VKNGVNNKQGKAYNGACTVYIIGDVKKLQTCDSFLHSTVGKVGKKWWWNYISKTNFRSLSPLYSYIRDGDISWTITSRGHFFSKWATSRGHCQRVTSRGHFLVTSRGRFCPREVLFLGWIFVDIFWVNSSGRFLMVIINSANRRGCGGEAPARLSKHCSVPG
jgi:hypothetical protein